MPINTSSSPDENKTVRNGLKLLTSRRSFNALNKNNVQTTNKRTNGIANPMGKRTRIDATSLRNVELRIASLPFATRPLLCSPPTGRHPFRLPSFLSWSPANANSLLEQDFHRTKSAVGCLQSWVKLFGSQALVNDFHSQWDETMILGHPM